jgi:hypothetical protein
VTSPPAIDTGATGRSPGADILRLLGGLNRVFKGRAPQSPCGPCPPAVRKPDPFLYSQFFLLRLGLPVTWDNPDIFVFEGNVLVDPHHLKPGADYTVVARIWNGSSDVPVVDLTVIFSYLSFGMGVQSHLIGTATTDLDVKGLPGCPTFAAAHWKTPAAAGHYCLQVLLEPPDDSNWLNNLGQRNTDVVRPKSPAQFGFGVGNHTEQPRRRVRFTVDAYTIPPLLACDAPPSEQSRRRGAARAPRAVPPGWTVDLSPAELVLVPGQERPVSVTITPPAGFIGTMPFNVTAWDEFGPFGGVTMTVEAP